MLRWIRNQMLLYARLRGHVSASGPVRFPSSASAMSPSTGAGEPTGWTPSRSAGTFGTIGPLLLLSVNGLALRGAGPPSPPSPWPVRRSCASRKYGSAPPSLRFSSAEIHRVECQRSRQGSRCLLALYVRIIVAHLDEAEIRLVGFDWIC